MNKQTDKDPFDVLSRVYETLYEDVAENIHELEEGGSHLYDIIERGRQKLVEIDEITEEDATQIADWLKRDLGEAYDYLAEKEHAVADWLGFEASMLENQLFAALLNVADRTTVELNQLREQADIADAGERVVYHAGEVVGPGTLHCIECGAEQKFYVAARIVRCFECGKDRFRR